MRGDARDPIETVRPEHLKSRLVKANTVALMERQRRDPPADGFERVKAAALALADVEAITRYDGAPVLRARGSFMAGIAMHPSAEPGTLVVRAAFEDREGLLADAPATYYLTDYYRRHPVVLVRLSRIDRGALGDLLAASWRLAIAKAGKRGRRRGPEQAHPPGRRRVMLQEDE